MYNNKHTIHNRVWRAAEKLSTLLCMAVFAMVSHDTCAVPAFPDKQASHFCQLMVNDGQGNTYPMSKYAHDLTALLCGQDRYGNLTAEQVLTGLIFFYDEWLEDSIYRLNDPNRRMLIRELHTGKTLRLFPHVMEDGTTVWYAPTDELPDDINEEHRRYISEVLPRMSMEVKTGNWAVVDQYINRISEYQLRFSTKKHTTDNTPYGIAALLLCAIICIVLFTWRKRRSASRG
jgi:hypothetical protein